METPSYQIGITDDDGQASLHGDVAYVTYGCGASGQREWTGWQFDDAGNGNVRIVNVKFNLAIDYNSNDTDQGALVSATAPSFAAQQLWVFQGTS